MSEHKIFGLGLSRTGTTSLHAALVALGISACHYPRAAGVAWFRGQYRHTSMDAYDAYTDLPTPAFYAELDRAWPEARFILTCRDVDRWLDSVGRFSARRPLPTRVGFEEAARLAVYGTLTFVPERYRNVYVRHCDNVIGHFAGRPGKLLVFDLDRNVQLADLCAFLGLGVPDLPYPTVRLPELIGNGMGVVAARDMARKQPLMIERIRQLAREAPARAT